LRYHAFRPITPDTNVLPADAGETTKAEVLWGDLLSQLRIIFKGRLARFQVPLRNEFLTVERIREHVLRLANELGMERGRPTIIAIDGIDHAARAGVDRYSFLETLIPPEQVPEHVRFLIVGQPSEAYDKYPIWIKGRTENVTHRTVEGGKREDIESLLSAKAAQFPDEEREAAVRLIDSIAQGNTLAAIFAVHEADYCENIGELKERLDNRQLTYGLYAYYDQIWSAALKPLQGAFPFIGDRIAGCFSLSNERITGQALSQILPEMQIHASVWTDILRALRPLLMEEEQGFRVTHNDVRVHLTKQVASQPEKLQEVASRLADYYWNTPDKGLARHSDLFHLLRISGRQVDQARVFTPQFVMEGYALNRPTKELLEQCKQAVLEVAGTEDWERVHTVVCAATTLKQLLKTVDWIGEKIEFISEIPPVLFSEGRVPNKESWTLEIVDNTMHDALRLVHVGELYRARGLMERWFANLSPLDLISLLPSNQIYDEWGHEKRFSDRISDMLRTWGRVSKYTGLMWDYESDSSSDEVMPLYFGGYLQESLENGGVFHWARAFKRAETFFWHDLEKWLDDLVNNRRWAEIAITLLMLEDIREQCPISLQVKAAAYVLLIGKEELIKTWVKPVSDAGFELLTDYDEPYTDKYIVLFCMVSFVLAWMHPHRENGGISNEGVSFYFRRGGDDRRREHVAILLYASAFVGNWLGIVIRKGPEFASKIVTVVELQTVLNALVSERKPWNKVYGSKDITKSILNLIVFCTGKIGSPFEQTFFNFIKQQCSAYPVSYLLEIGWPYLADRGEDELLLSWFDYWCGPSGVVWHDEVANRVDIVNRFARLLSITGYQDKAREATQLLKWGMIGYTGHKEYILEGPLSWYQELQKIRPDLWQTEGKRLLELSQEATKTGDNRIAYLIQAAVSESVALSGVSDMWRFFNATNIHTPLIEEPHILFDGIIAMLEVVRLTEQDLLGIWAFGIGVFMWQAGEDRSYLHDLKVAILTAAERGGLDSIAEKMEELGKTEFLVSVDNVRYKIPARWFNQNENDSKPGLLELYESSIENAIERINESVISETQYSSGIFEQSISLVVRRLKKERPTDFNRYINRLLEIIGVRLSFNKWAGDRASAYSELIKIIPEHTRLEILRSTIAGIEFESDNYWIDNVVENLDKLCRYRAIAIGEAALSEGIRRLIDTHELWVNGNGFLPEVQRISIPSLEHVDNPPTTWMQFAVRYLFRVLKSDNGSRIEAALRGLWAITQINPSDMNYINDRWAELPPRAKEWMLLIVERVAHCAPEAFDFFSEIVSQCYNGTNLKLKLQAWIVLQALERTTGQKCEVLKFEEHPNYGIIKSVTDEYHRGVLDIPSTSHGSIASISGVQIIHSILRLLEAAMVDGVEDIEGKYASFVLRYPPSPNKDMEVLKKNNGEMKVFHSPEVDVLMDIIYSELYSGRWNDMPPVRLAQALTTGDDPFILLSSPKKAIDAEKWIVDDDLDSLLKDREVLKSQLLQNIQAGLSSDEIVLAAVLFTYSRSHDVKMVYNLALRDQRFALFPVTRSSTFNGRSFALYDIDRYDPLIQMKPAITMGYESGGIGNFVNQNFLIYPSHIWSTVFGFEPSSVDPTVWLHDNHPIIRLEYCHGRIRDLMQDRLYRQPVMQRWVCSREAFEKIADRLGFVYSPFSTVRVDQLK